MHRVLVAAPPDERRAALVAAIRAGGMACDTRACPVSHVLTVLSERQYSCVVVSTVVPGLDKAAWRSLAGVADPAPVLVQLDDAADPALMDALWAGARGAILARYPERAPAAIRAALAGDVALPREATTVLVSTLIRQQQMLVDEGPLSQLTERERQVLRLVQEGRSTVEIARELVVAPVTVRSHISGILRKLHVPDRQAAIDLLSLEGRGPARPVRR